MLNKDKYFHFTYILLLLILSQNSSSKAQNLQYLDNDFRNIEFNPKFENVKYISLGEALHGMANTHQSKTKLVKILHEKYDFNILAFESPIYDMCRLDKNLKQDSTLDYTYISKNISGVWSQEDMFDLYKYILLTYSSKTPLRLTGFDESFYESNTLTQDFIEFIGILNKNSEVQITYDSLFVKALKTTVDYCFYYNKVPTRDTLILHNKFLEISNELTKQSPDTKFTFWQRIMENLTSVYRKNFKLANREKQMYKNVQYLIDHKFPDEKIIFWGATSHLMNNKKAIESYQKIPSKFNTNQLGALLKKEYGDKYYSIAFTPYKGHFGFKGYLGLLKTKVRTKKNSFEEYIFNNYDCEFVFADFHKNDVRVEIKNNNITKSNIIWNKGLHYTGETMHILEAVDAVIYYENERLTILPLSNDKH